MTLDMYAYRLPITDREFPDVDGVFHCPTLGEPFVDMVEIAFWSDHQELHDWMWGLYRSRGGGKADFECAYLRLYPEDIDRLELDMAVTFRSGEGVSRADEADFLKKARETFSFGESVFYFSWS